MIRLQFILICLISCLTAFAHDKHHKHTDTDGLTESQFSSLQYLGNAGVMVKGQKSKILFDPFFHNHFGQYALVPDAIRERIFANQAPYDDVDALFVSHMHEDHFDAADTITYLQKNARVKVFLPEQARKSMLTMPGFDAVKDRIHGVDRALGQEALTINLNELTIEAIYIPHAGWPNRSFVQNIVFRVSSADEFSVMHFGDATDELNLYEAHEQFWQARQTQIGLIPFWLALSEDGRTIINSIINVERNIGVHVPARGYPALEKLGLEHLIVPGESKKIQ